MGALAASLSQLMHAHAHKGHIWLSLHNACNCSATPLLNAASRRVSLKGCISQWLLDYCIAETSFNLYLYC